MIDSVCATEEANIWQSVRNVRRPRARPGKGGRQPLQNAEPLRRVMLLPNGAQLGSAGQPLNVARRRSGDRPLGVHLLLKADRPGNPASRARRSRRRKRCRKRRRADRHHRKIPSLLTRLSRALQVLSLPSLPPRINKQSHRPGVTLSVRGRDIVRQLGEVCRYSLSVQYHCNCASGCSGR
jgi:hypothetical protein